MAAHRKKASRRNARKRRPRALAGTPEQHRAEVRRVGEQVTVAAGKVRAAATCEQRIFAALHFYQLLGRFDANYSDAFHAAGTRSAQGAYRYIKNQVEDAKRIVGNRVVGCIRRDDGG